MLDRPVAAFDIETIPDPEHGRRALGLEGSDGDVIREMVRLRLEETGGRNEYPQLPWHRVVCGCVTLLDPRTSRVEIRALGGDPLDERSHVQGFYDLFEETGEVLRIVSWNGSGFDLPVLRYRAMMLGVAAPGFHRDDEHRHADDYLTRRHDLHVDVMDVLSGYGASSRVGLESICLLLGLPAKRFLERAVYEHVLAGEGAIVEQYCKLDTLDTLLTFLVYSHHRGRLAPADLRRHVDGVAAAVRGLGLAGWDEIATALAAWPPWAPVSA